MESDAFTCACGSQWFVRAENVSVKDEKLLPVSTRQLMCIVCTGRYAWAEGGYQRAYPGHAMTRD